MPINTRVGCIVEGDNRFLGRSVYHEWERSIETPADPLLHVLGVTRLDSVTREAFRLLSLCVMSPDARVWPLKLTRLLASWGDPIAGFFGAQLVTAGRVMGPGATTFAAQALTSIARAVGTEPTLASVQAAAERFKDETQAPLAGFGVPFRDVDERRVALLRFVGDGPLSQRAYWKLHQLLVETQAPAAPNCIISFAALLLDAGVPPERCGLAVTLLMPHVFAAHALEASTLDGAKLNSWPVTQVKYKGAGPRTVGDGQKSEVRRALKRQP